MIDRIAQIPGVESVGITHNMHLNLNRWTMEVQVDGVEPPKGQESFVVDKATVDPGFFDAVGIPILRGRSFNPSDRTDTQKVVIVSAAMAEKFWPDRDPIGLTLRGDDEELVVVGIARDAKVRDLGESPQSFIYLPYSQNYSASMEIIARTDIAPERTALEMVGVARELDHDLILWEPKTMEQHLGFVLLPFRLSALLLSVFAVLAVVLASVGLYGIVSYAVSQRTREVGIRMSLGANATTVTLLLMRSGMKLVAVGSAAGLVLAAFFSRALSGLLFGIDALDTWTFVASPLILLTVAAVAAYVAAHRASRINPVNALRA
jgi:putative ABC transport system permease protein